MQERATCRDRTIRPGTRRAAAGASLSHSDGLRRAGVRSEEFRDDDCAAAAARTARRSSDAAAASAAAGAAEFDRHG